MEKWQFLRVADTLRPNFLKNGILFAPRDTENVLENLFIKQQVLTYQSDFQTRSHRSPS